MKKQMVKVITTLVMISVLLLLVACGQSNNKSVNSSVNSPKENKKSDSSSEPVKEAENTKDSSGDIEWSEGKLNLTVGLFRVSILNDWAFNKYTTLAVGGTFDKSYRLYIDGYDTNYYDPVPANLTLEELPEFLQDKIKEDLPKMGGLGGDSEQTIDKKEIVNVNGLEMLKVNGEILQKEREGKSVKYFGYYAFFTNLDNEFDKSEDVPIYLLMLVDSEEVEKIKYGEKMLDAVVGTLEKHIFGSK